MGSPLSLVSNAKSSARPIIQLRDISKSFQGPRGIVDVMKDISIDIEENTFVSVVGPSGCGKSTILNMAAGLVRPTSGTILYQGGPIDGVNTRVGYVTQESKLFPWLTVEENVGFALGVRGYSKEDKQRLLKEHMAMVGLTGFEKSYPYQLSGGMQKRASIIRTLIYDPEVVLMDEPFGPLDAQTRMLLQDELLRIWTNKKKTILFITHDLVEAIALSDVIVVMTHRPSTIRAVIKVPLKRPRNVFEIHQMEGFTETYDQLWKIFRHELHV